MTINIAVADDHTIFRKSLIRLINDWPMLNVVADCGNGKELLDTLEDTAGKVTVVLLDLQMPVMDGMTCLQILRAKYPEIKVIILSQLTGALYVKTALEKGAFGFFSKEADPELLMETILNAANSEHFHTNLPYASVETQVTSSPRTFEFSKRELEVISLSSADLSSREIAEKLGISIRTVEGHKNNLLKKTGCHSFLGVVVIAMELHLI